MRTSGAFVGAVQPAVADLDGNDHAGDQDSDDGPHKNQEHDHIAGDERARLSGCS
jgi:hypothetical protein